jgi:SH3-like domain-containing protein
MASQRRRSPGAMTAARLLSGLGLVLGLLGSAVPAWANQYRSVGDEPAVLYDAPSSKSKRLFVLGAGYPLEVLVALEGWTKVRDAAGTIGWVEAPSLSARRNVVVRAVVGEVRATADPSAKVAFRVARGVLLEWMETTSDGWVRVRHAEAGQGFLRSSDLWGA